MASGVYEKAKEKFLNGTLDLTGNLKAVLVDTATYSVDLTADEFLSSIPAGERVATSGNLASKTFTNGVFDCQDVVFTAVSGDQCEAVVIYNDTGLDTTSELIAYIDNTSATGLPVTPNGGNITIAWDNGANKVFKL